MADMPETNRVTLANVAARAGVSQTTASLILSGRPARLRQFSAETVRKVRECAEEMGYRSNLFASSLQPRSARFFALVLRGAMYDYSSPWYHYGFEGDLLMGVIRAASEEGVYPVVATADPEADDAGVRTIEGVIAGGVFGAIIRSPSRRLEERLCERHRQRAPLVVVFPEHISQWKSNVIDVDNAAIGRTAGEMFAARAGRRWALVNFEEVLEAHRVRQQAFEEAAARCGATVDVIDLPAGIEEDVGVEILSPHLKSAVPDAVFGTSAVSSVVAVKTLAKLGVQVGERTLVVGCDCALWSSPPLPRITTIDISWGNAGAEAMRALLDLRSRDGHDFPNILLSPRILPGDSCPVPEKFLAAGRGGATVGEPPG